LRLGGATDLLGPCQKRANLVHKLVEILLSQVSWVDAQTFAEGKCVNGVGPGGPPELDSYIRADCRFEHDYRRGDSGEPPRSSSSQREIVQKNEGSAKPEDRQNAEAQQLPPGRREGHQGTEASDSAKARYQKTTSQAM
jgi:hypothetical protein